MTKQEIKIKEVLDKINLSSESIELKKAISFKIDSYLDDLSTHFVSIICNKDKNIIGASYIKDDELGWRRDSGSSLLDVALYNLDNDISLSKLTSDFPENTILRIYFEKNHLILLEPCNLEMISEEIAILLKEKYYSIQNTISCDVKILFSTDSAPKILWSEIDNFSKYKYKKCQIAKDQINCIVSLLDHQVSSIRFTFVDGILKILIKSTLTNNEKISFVINTKGKTKEINEEPILIR